MLGSPPTGPAHPGGSRHLTPTRCHSRGGWPVLGGMDAEHSIALPSSAAGNARSVTVVGGGLGGLVAAIRRAEQGVPAVLHEANRRLGGRAGSTGPPFIANHGPHGLYADGITWRFLRERRI